MGMGNLLGIKIGRMFSMYKFGVQKKKISKITRG